MGEAVLKQESESWKDVLAAERSESYFQELLSFVESERACGKSIYPSNSLVFNALQLTPFSDVKVVIIGQDPYHGPGQAHGLCFSVRPNVPFPPSLQNIYKELIDDMGIAAPSSGCLEKWASQGVLLLNAVLTVEAGKPESHANRGWERFTDKVIQVINEKKEGIVFLLWGSYAQKKGEKIDPRRHYILKAPHPSPLSAHRGFLGCKHFSRTNEILSAQDLKPIDWSV